MTEMAIRSFNFFTKKQSGLLVVITLLVILFAIGAFVSDRFSTSSNLMNVFEQSTGLALVSLGQTMTVLTAGIDLSVGSMISLLSVLTSGFIDGEMGRVLPVCLGIMVLGALLGSINGLTVIWLRVHPLIVTLGMGALLQGVTLLYTLGPAGSVPFEFDFVAYGRVLGLPVGALFVIVLFVLVALFLRYTPFGRAIYAVGDDETGARLMGLPRRKVIIFVYAFSGFCCALTAIFLVGRFGVGNVYTGQNFTLASITPVVVGGTMLTGGRGGVIGTLFGVYLISLLNNLLNFMDISSHYQLIIQGLIIILAVSVYVERKRAV